MSNFLSYVKDKCMLQNTKVLDTSESPHTSFDRRIHSDPSTNTKDALLPLCFMKPWRTITLSALCIHCLQICINCICWVCNCAFLLRRFTLLYVSREWCTGKNKSRIYLESVTLVCFKCYIWRICSYSCVTFPVIFVSIFITATLWLCPSMPNLTCCEWGSWSCKRMFYWEV